MNHPDQQCVNLSKPEELLYWARKLNVKPLHLLHAVKVTGSNLVKRMIWYLKAEGLMPHHFEPDKSFV